MKKIFIAMIFLFVLRNVQAELKSELVDYKDGDVLLEGYLVYDESLTGPRPGVLVVHEWRGLNDYAKRRAEELARMGYIAFALDMYGKGVYAENHQEAAKLSGVFRDDRNLMRTRARSGLEVLRKHPLSDDGKIAAIGYCFGGMAVLELARSGENLKGAASFHGGLNTPHPEDAKNIKCPIIVFHGGDEKFVSDEEVSGFESEMRDAKVDWQMVIYGGAVHAFTVPEAGNDPSTGLAYHEKADHRSWRALENFLNEIFSS